MAELIVVWGLGLIAIYFAYLACKWHDRAKVLMEYLKAIYALKNAYDDAIFFAAYRARQNCDIESELEQALYEHAAYIELISILGLSEKYTEFLKKKNPSVSSCPKN